MGMYPRGDFRTGWRFLVHVFYTKVAPLGLLDGESQGPRRIPVETRKKSMGFLLTMFGPPQGHFALDLVNPWVCRM